MQRNYWLSVVLSLRWSSALRALWTPVLCLVVLSAVCSLLPSSLTGQIVTTLAGAENNFADGIGANARFYQPQDVCTDGAGNLYVTDTDNYRIRKIVIATGEVTTLAGGTSGFANGTGTAAQFNGLKGITSDGRGNLYIVAGNTIRKIVIATGVVTTLVWGNYTTLADGKTVVNFKYPYGIANDGRGNLYVSDADSCRIQKVVIATGEVTTLAGSTRGTTDGIGTKAQFSYPIGLTTDDKGNLYVADAGNHTIRKVVIATGEVTTLAGGIRGSMDGIGVSARFSSPNGIVYDGIGNLYISGFNVEV